MNASGEIKAFLDWLTECETQVSISTQNLSDRNDEIQDIMHYLELNDAPYIERKKLTDLLPDIRRQRRIAKDTEALLAPIAEWAKNNKKVVHELRQLLGEVRKEENRQRNRAYMYRTSIVKETIGHQ